MSVVLLLDWPLDPPPPCCHLADGRFCWCFGRASGVFSGGRLTLRFSAGVMSLGGRPSQLAAWISMTLLA